MDGEKPRLPEDGNRRDHGRAAPKEPLRTAGKVEVAQQASRAAFGNMDVFNPARRVQLPYQLIR